MKITTDIDLDFADRQKALQGLPCVPATTVKSGRRQRHPVGVYFQDIPTHPLDKGAALDYETAEDLGYFKLDFLTNSVYEGIRDEDHLITLTEMEPDWALLEHPEIVGSLAHIRDHFGIVQHVQPRSIEDLAIVLALMRPGKRYLLSRSMDDIRKEIWTESQDGYVFKRAHAIAYAMTIVIQMNKMCEEMAERLSA